MALFKRTGRRMELTPVGWHVPTLKKSSRPARSWRRSFAMVVRGALSSFASSSPMRCPNSLPTGCWHHSRRSRRTGLADIPASAVDIDIMIGERDAVGRVWGSKAIALVARKRLSDPAVPFVMACASLNDVASQRAFAKAGFRRDKEFDDVPFGPHVLMVLDRQHAEQT